MKHVYAEECEVLFSNLSVKTRQCMRLLRRMRERKKIQNTEKNFKLFLYNLFTRIYNGERMVNLKVLAIKFVSLQRFRRNSILIIRRTILTANEFLRLQMKCFAVNFRIYYFLGCWALFFPRNRLSSLAVAHFTITAVTSI